jgi:hypothetical protein
VPPIEALESLLVIIVVVLAGAFALELVAGWAAGRHLHAAWRADRASQKVLATTRVYREATRLELEKVERWRLANEELAESNKRLEALWTKKHALVDELTATLNAQRALLGVATMDQVLREREECARIVEEHAAHAVHGVCGHDVAGAIRARGAAS